MAKIYKVVVDMSKDSKDVLVVEQYGSPKYHIKVTVLGDTCTIKVVRRKPEDEALVNKVLSWVKSDAFSPDFFSIAKFLRGVVDIIKPSGFPSLDCYFGQVGGDSPRSRGTFVVYG